jgi:hypothetical protein
VVGTSTSGISDSEALLKQYFEGIPRLQFRISHKKWGASQKHCKSISMARGCLYDFDGMFF